jgi:hypothetical protein
VYEFQVNSSLDNLQDVIVKVYWRRQAIAEPNGVAYAYEMKGETDLAAPNKADFIQFDNLTQDIVIPWLESAIDMTELNNQLDIELDKIINPTFPIKPIPWQVEI